MRFQASQAVAGAVGRVVVPAKDGHAIALAYRRLARHLDQLCGEDGDGGQP